MARGLMRTVGGLLLSVIVGCGEADEGEVQETLTQADVENVPVGDAQGSALSGVYVLDESDMLGCRCRVGSCADWFETSLATLRLTQADGAVTIHWLGQYDEMTYHGGVDGDGSFVVGGWRQSERSRTYSQLEGTIAAQTSMNARSKNTFVGRIGGKDQDCDVSAKLTISYVTALP